jgi:ATP-binding cassette subfamily F protein 3
MLQGQHLRKSYGAVTVLAVSHDRAFLRSFAERVVEVRAGRVRLFPGGYDDYLEGVRRG